MSEILIAARKRLADYAEWLDSLEESDYDPNQYSKAQNAADIRLVLDALSAPEREVEFAATRPAFESLPRAVDEPRSCNRHRDCNAADKRAKDAGQFRAEHCHDDCCEDCFGY